MVLVVAVEAGRRAARRCREAGRRVGVADPLVAEWQADERRLRTLLEMVDQALPPDRIELIGQHRKSAFPGRPRDRRGRRATAPRPKSAARESRSARTSRPAARCPAAALPKGDRQERCARPARKNAEPPSSAAPASSGAASVRQRHARRPPSRARGDRGEVSRTSIDLACEPEPGREPGAQRADCRTPRSRAPAPRAANRPAHSRSQATESP